MILYIFMHPLNHIDLAIIWPVFAQRPERGPCATGRPGHVAHVQDEEAPREAPFRLDPDASSADGGTVGVVDAHVDAVPFVAD